MPAYGETNMVDIVMFR